MCFTVFNIFHPHIGDLSLWSSRSFVLLTGIRDVDKDKDKDPRTRTVRHTCSHAKAADQDSLNPLVEDAGLHGARRSNGSNEKWWPPQASHAVKSIWAHYDVHPDCLQERIYKPESGKDLCLRSS